MKSKRDLVGDNINSGLSSWSYGSNNAEQFDEHVYKSVPGYEAGHSLIAAYSDFFINLTPNLVYDLGCSTGSLIKKIQARHKSFLNSLIRRERHKKKERGREGIETGRSHLEIACVLCQLLAALEISKQTFLLRIVY